jgi:hypothetical protein
MYRSTFQAYVHTYRDKKYVEPKNLCAGAATHVGFGYALRKSNSEQCPSSIKCYAEHGF